MIEKINVTTANANGNVSYWIADTEKQVPYASVTVNPEGDFWYTVYGKFSFGISSHSKILEVAKPTGKNITADLFYASKNKKK